MIFFDIIIYHSNQNSAWTQETQQELIGTMRKSRQHTTFVHRYHDVVPVKIFVVLVFCYTYACIQEDRWLCKQNISEKYLFKCAKIKMATFRKNANVYSIYRKFLIDNNINGLHVKTHRNTICIHSNNIQLHGNI